jgi:hypothetical protein
MLSQAQEKNMAKLTDTQLIVLSKAARREDGAAGVPDRMNKAAAAKVGASLVVRRLMREIRAKPGMPVWRMDDQREGDAPGREPAEKSRRCFPCLPNRGFWEAASRLICVSL